MSRNENKKEEVITIDFVYGISIQVPISQLSLTGRKYIPKTKIVPYKYE